MGALKKLSDNARSQSNTSYRYKAEETEVYLLYHPFTNWSIRVFGRLGKLIVDDNTNVHSNLLEIGFFFF